MVSDVIYARFIFMVEIAHSSQHKTINVQNRCSVNGLLVWSLKNCVCVCLQIVCTYRSRLNSGHFTTMRITSNYDTIIIYVRMNDGTASKPHTAVITERRTHSAHIQRVYISILNSFQFKVTLFNIYEYACVCVCRLKCVTRFSAVLLASI